MIVKMPNNKLFILFPDVGTTKNKKNMAEMIIFGN